MFIAWNSRKSRQVKNRDCPDKIGTIGKYVSTSGLEILIKLLVTNY